MEGIAQQLKEILEVVLDLQVKYVGMSERMGRLENKLETKYESLREILLWDTAQVEGGRKGQNEDDRRMGEIFLGDGQRDGLGLDSEEKDNKKWGKQRESGSEAMHNTNTVNTALGLTPNLMPEESSHCNWAYIGGKGNGKANEGKKRKWGAEVDNGGDDCELFLGWKPLGNTGQGRGKCAGVEKLYAHSRQVQQDLVDFSAHLQGESMYDGAAVVDRGKETWTRIWSGANVCMWKKNPGSRKRRDWR